MFRQALPAIITLVFFFILLGVYTKLSGPIPFSVNSVTTTKTDTFNVTGEGKAFAIPDLASVNAGITANGTTVKQVQDQINLTSKKITDAIKNLGVSEKDIQTTNYSINPDYDFTGGSQRIKGYSANTTLSIKIRDLEKINQVIDAATQNGANQINQVNFEVSDKTQAENEAREKAVADAKKKAQQASKVGGFQLGRLINYSEQSGGDITVKPLPIQAGSVRDIAETEVEPGTSEIVISVTLSFEIK